MCDQSEKSIGAGLRCLLPIKVQLPCSANCPQPPYLISIYDDHMISHVSPFFFLMTWSSGLTTWPLQRICDLCHSASQNCCLELSLSITTNHHHHHNNSIHSTQVLQQSTTTKQPKDVGVLNATVSYSITWWSTANQEPVMPFGAPSRSSAGGLPTAQHSTAFAYHAVDVWCVIRLCLNRFVCRGVGKCSVEFCTSRLYNPLETNRIKQISYKRPGVSAVHSPSTNKMSQDTPSITQSAVTKKLRKALHPSADANSWGTHWAPRDVQWLSACNGPKPVDS